MSFPGFWEQTRRKEQEDKPQRRRKRRRSGGIGETVDALQRLHVAYIGAMATWLYAFLGKYGDDPDALRAYCDDHRVLEVLFAEPDLLESNAAIGLLGALGHDYVTDALDVWFQPTREITREENIRFDPLVTTTGNILLWLHDIKERAEDHLEERALL